MAVNFQIDDQAYKPKDMAKMLGITVQTLRDWDRNGTLVALRTPTNRRYYTHTQYLEYMRNAKPKSASNIDVLRKQNRVVLYVNCREQNEFKGVFDKLNGFATSKRCFVVTTLSVYGSSDDSCFISLNTLMKLAMLNEIDGVLLGRKSDFGIHLPLVEKILELNDVSIIEVDKELGKEAAAI